MPTFQWNAQYQQEPTAEEEILAEEQVPAEECGAYAEGRNDELNWLQRIAKRNSSLREIEELES